MKISIEQLNEILTLAEKYEYKPDEWHRKNLANACGSDEILSMVRELITLRELKGEQVPFAYAYHRDMGVWWLSTEKPKLPGYTEIRELFTAPQKPEDLPYDVLFNAIGKAVNIQGQALSISVKAFKAAIEAAGGVVKGGE